MGNLLGNELVQEQGSSRKNVFVMLVVAFVLAISCSLFAGAQEAYAEPASGAGSSAAIDHDQQAKACWMKSGNRWWYKNADGSYPSNTTMNIDGKTYCFDKSGWMRTGWAKTENTWHYFTKSGVMTTGWQKVSGKWYYLDRSGAMKIGWQSINGTWYFLNSSGAMKTGWLKQGGAWYYLKGSGAMATGWQKASGKWYYMSGSGAMQANKWISGKYWVGASGAMATNSWVDGKKYYVGSNGAWIPNYGKKSSSSSSSSAVQSGKVVYSSTSDVYHINSNCSAAKRIKNKNYTTVANAQAIGLRPCHLCS